MNILRKKNRRQITSKVNYDKYKGIGSFLWITNFYSQNPFVMKTKQANVEGLCVFLGSRLL